MNDEADRWANDLPDATEIQYSEIGRAIMYWASLEEKLNNAIGISLRLTWAQSFSLTLPIINLYSRLEILYGLWQHTDVNIAENELKPIIEEVKRLYSIRNMYAHRPWYAQSAENLFSFKWNPKQLPFHPAEEHSLESITQTCKDIVLAIDALQNFLEKNGNLENVSSD